jgi:hypothetical protein
MLKSLPVNNYKRKIKFQKSSFLYFVISVCFNKQLAIDFKLINSSKVILKLGLNVIEARKENNNVRMQKKMIDRNAG